MILLCAAVAVAASSAHVVHRRAPDLGPSSATVVHGVRASAAAAFAPRSFRRAFTDDVWFYGPDWTARTVATGASLVLLEIDWAGVESSAPAPGTDPTSPSDPQYKFGYIDAVLRQFESTGIQAAFLVSDAPTWAEAPGGPASLEAAGAWRPDPNAFGQFATALARRYSGSYPDPLNPGQTLPRVRYYQAWAEANINIHLSPQWVNTNGSWVQTGPDIYRGLLNAFYAGVKVAHQDNVVLTSGFGPYGDPPGPCVNSQAGPGCRMPPATFVRGLLCLKGQALVAAACPNPPHFDATAIDPYEVGAPTTHARNINDVAAPDLGRLTTMVNKAVRVGHALPNAPKQLWVTEFSYDSNPPNPTAVSVATQARWLEESFYVFWQEGVSTDVWYLLRDQPGTDYSTSYFSGVYFNNGTPKPSFEAYRFPFVVMPSGKRATVWGISPRAGTVAVRHQVGGSWKTLFSVKVSAGGVFVRTISARLHGSFSAVVGGESSLVWQR